MTDEPKVAVYYIEDKEGNKIAFFFDKEICEKVRQILINNKSFHNITIQSQIDLLEELYKTFVTNNETALVYADSFNGIGAGRTIELKISKLKQQLKP